MKYEQREMDLEYLTIPELAAKCRCTAAAVMVWLNCGKVPSYKKGNRIYFKSAEIDALIATEWSHSPPTSKNMAKK